MVEQGTHVDLMTKGGEYYKLHNIQSQALAPVSTTIPHRTIFISHTLRRRTRFTFLYYQTMDFPFLRRFLDHVVCISYRKIVPDHVTWHHANFSIYIFEIRFLWSQLTVRDEYFVHPCYYIGYSSLRCVSDIDTFTATNMEFGNKDRPLR